MTVLNLEAAVRNVIGADVQAWDAQLDDIAALSVTDGNFIVGDGSNWIAESGATARASLGLPVPDNEIIVKGSADATKLMRFEIDGFTTGQTRVLTPPDQDFTLAGLEVANIFTVGQMIDGTADEVQLMVQANGTQTANIWENQDSTGNVLSGADERGILFCNGTTNITNVFIGDDAGNISGSGTGNVGIGSETLRFFTTAEQCVAMGNKALEKITTGGQNVGIGNGAGRNLTTGNGNFAFGAAALRDCVIGAFNVAIGRNALKVATGEGNLGIGDSTLESLTTGVNNVAVGKAAARSATNTLSGCIYIGQRAGFSNTTANALYISNSDTTTPLIYGEFDNSLLKFYADNADTDVIHDVLYLVHNSSNTPATNFGTGLLFQGESTTTPSQDMARIASPWSDATHPTRSADIVFETVDDGNALAESVRIDSLGGMIINEQGNDSDTRIESNTEENLFRVDAGEDVVRMGDWDTNYAQFAIDGELTLVGTARVKTEIQVKAEAFRLGGTAPTPVVIGSFSVLQFPGTGATRSIYTSFHIPNDWAVGTDIEVHVHWAPVNADAGTVVWQLTWDAVASEANEVISGAGTSTFVSDATQTLQDELLESGSMTISGGSLTSEDTIGMCIFRDPSHGSDSYGSAASLVIIEISYTADKLGEAT